MIKKLNVAVIAFVLSLLVGLFVDWAVGISPNSTDGMIINYSLGFIIVLFFVRPWKK